MDEFHKAPFKTFRSKDGLNGAQRLNGLNGAQRLNGLNVLNVFILWWAAVV
jgi:hypothetical protein